MRVRFVGQDGAETIAEGLEGDTVLRFATDNSVDGIIGECGGLNGLRNLSRLC